MKILLSLYYILNNQFFNKEIKYFNNIILLKIR